MSKQEIRDDIKTIELALSSDELTPTMKKILETSLDEAKKKLQGLENPVKTQRSIPQQQVNPDQVPKPILVELPKQKEQVVKNDIGSGSFISANNFGISAKKTVLVQTVNGEQFEIDHALSKARARQYFDHVLSLNKWEENPSSVKTLPSYRNLCVYYSAFCKHGDKLQPLDEMMTIKKDTRKERIKDGEKLLSMIWESMKEMESKNQE